jgi:hypothetical protein
MISPERNYINAPSHCLFSFVTAQGFANFILYVIIAVAAVAAAVAAAAAADVPPSPSSLLLTILFIIICSSRFMRKCTARQCI